jgi:nucleoid-associated protein YgaU
MGTARLAEFGLSAKVCVVSRDYRIGLIAGVFLAGVALIWVATRPSLRPQLPTDALRASSPSSKATPSSSVSQEVVSPSPASPPAPSATDQPAQDKTEPVPAPTPRIHIVRSGETLSGIAQQYYGSTSQWRKILTANPEGIKDANKIAPGTKLIIP